MTITAAQLMESIRTQRRELDGVDEDPVDRLSMPELRAAARLARAEIISLRNRCEALETFRSNVIALEADRRLRLCEAALGLPVGG
jgi:hypothetical protein